MVSVLQVGFYSTIQDIGRYGYQHLGVPVSGSMDALSARAANSSIGNPLNAAVIEATFIGPVLQFETDSHFAVTGASVEISLNGRAIPACKPVRVLRGDRLSFGKVQAGVRFYIAVAGGFQSPTVLGSRSFYPGITQATLAAGDKIPTGTSGSHVGVGVGSDTIDLKTKVLHVSKGPEYDLLSRQDLDRIMHDNFTVSHQNSRMGYHLNEMLPPNPHSIITSGVMPGTVQLTPAGRLIILMRDCQTTGGYPRILQLSSRSVSLLAQKKMGDTIRFLLGE